jgi:hypothetical protein
MRVDGKEYDTWNWRFCVGDIIEHGGTAYDILARRVITDDQGVETYVYTLESPDGLVRDVRNYIINLEASRARVKRWKQRRVGGVKSLPHATIAVRT